MTVGGAHQLTDGLGSVRASADASGTVSGAVALDVFGATRTGTAGLFGFTGEQTDPTGQVHLRARNYLPDLARFGARDTVQPNAPGSQGWNLYSYVANNPTTWTDPSGNVSFADVIGGLAIQEVLVGVTVLGVSGYLLAQGINSCAQSGCVDLSFPDLAGTDPPEVPSWTCVTAGALSEYGAEAFYVLVLGAESDPALTAAGAVASSDCVNDPRPGRNTPTANFNTNGGGSSVSAANNGLGDLIQVTKADPAADKLAARLGGESRVRFSLDPNGREFDVVSDAFIAQTKPGGLTLGSDFRAQAKKTFEFAIQTARTPTSTSRDRPAVMCSASSMSTSNDTVSIPLSMSRRWTRQ